MCDDLRRALTAFVIATAGCSDADLDHVADAGPRDATMNDARAIEDATIPDDAPSDVGSGRDGEQAPDAARLDAGPTMDADAAVDATIERDAAPSVVWSVAPSDTVELPIHGGASGGSFNAGACPESHLVVGTQGLAATVPVRVTVACSRLRAEGTLTLAAPAGTFGGGTDGSPFDDACAPGELVVGLHGFTVFPAGASDAYVNRLGVSCVPLVEWATGDDSHLTMLESHGDAQPDDVLFDERCPFGYALREIHGRSGAFIDAVGGTCVRIVHEP